MRSKDVTNLSDEQLRELARPRPDDPHRLFKESGARQRDAVLSIIREPPAPPADLAGSRKAVTILEKQLAEAQRQHNRTFRPDQTFGTDCQRSLAAIARINTALHIARARVADMQKAEASRAARNEPLSVA